MSNTDLFSKIFKIEGDQDILVTSVLGGGFSVGTYVDRQPHFVLLSEAHLHDFADWIKENIPEPTPIKDARFIHAYSKDFGEYSTLAKIDDAWYDHNGTAYTEAQVLSSYDEIDVIR